jgi:hypothetical protein
MTLSTKIAQHQLYTNNLFLVVVGAQETLRVPVHAIERECEAIDLRATIVWP